MVKHESYAFVKQYAPVPRFCISVRFLFLISSENKTSVEHSFSISMWPAQYFLNIERDSAQPRIYNIYHDADNFIRL